MSILDDQIALMGKTANEVYNREIEEMLAGVLIFFGVDDVEIERSFSFTNIIIGGNLFGKIYSPRFIEEEGGFDVSQITVVNDVGLMY